MVEVDVVRLWSSACCGRRRGVALAMSDWMGP